MMDTSNKGPVSFEDLFGATNFSMQSGVQTDNLSDIGIMQDISEINLDEIENSAMSNAEQVVTGLAGYFIDEEYLEKHPYIKTKVSMEMDMIRLLLKMLRTNEASLDSIVKGISLDPGKAALYAALTSLQTAASNMQKQLREHTEALEVIFQKMEDDTERTFAVKDKEDNDGVLTVRGTKEFLLKLKEMSSSKKYTETNNE